MMGLSLMRKLGRPPWWAGSLPVLFFVCSLAYGESALDYWKEAQQLQSQGKYEQALALYDQGLRISPKHKSAYKIYNNRGLVYYSQGAYR